MSTTKRCRTFSENVYNKNCLVLLLLKKISALGDMPFKMPLSLNRTPLFREQDVVSKSLMLNPHIRSNVLAGIRICRGTALTTHVQLFPWIYRLVYAPLTCFRGSFIRLHNYVSTHLMQMRNPGICHNNRGFVHSTYHFFCF